MEYLLVLTLPQLFMFFDFGGAMSIVGRSAVQIVSSVFTWNTVAIRGGALDIQYFSTVIIIGSTLIILVTTWQKEMVEPFS